MRAWIKLLLLTLGFYASFCLAQNTAMQKIQGRVLVDASGQMQAPQVLSVLQAGGGEAYQSDRFYWYQNGKRVWFLLTVPPSATVEQYLTLFYTDIPLIEEYAITPQATLRGSVGVDVPVVRWGVPHTQPAFEIAPGQNQIFLSALPDIGMHFNWQTQNRYAFETARKWNLLMTGVYVGWVIFIVLVALQHGISMREGAYFAYALHALVCGMAVLGIVGVTGYYLWPHSAYWNRISIKIMPILAFGTIALFTYALMRKNLRPWQKSMLLFPLGFGVFLTLCIFFIGFHPFIELSLVQLLSLFFCVMPMLAIYALRVNPKGWWIFAGAAALGLGSIVALLRNISLFPQNPLSFWAIQIGCALDLLLMLIGLNLSTRSRRDQMVREAALQNKDPVTGTFNDKTARSRLQLALDFGARHQSDIAVARIRVSNQAYLLAEYGEQIAAGARVHAASCLQQVCSVGDFVATLSNNDFLIIFKEALSEAQLRSKLSQIVAAGLRDSPHMPSSEYLQFHMSFSQDARPWPTADEQLDALDDMLVLIAQEPRKVIRSIDQRKDGGATSLFQPFGADKTAYLPGK